jgi:hypothetical protein
LSVQAGRKSITPNTITPTRKFFIVGMGFVA